MRGAASDPPGVEELREQESRAERRDEAHEGPLLDLPLDAPLGAARLLARAFAITLQRVERFLAFIGAEIAHRARQRLQVFAHVVELAAQAIHVPDHIDGHRSSSVPAADATSPEPVVSILTPASSGAESVRSRGEAARRPFETATTAARGGLSAAARARRGMRRVPRRATAMRER